VSVEVWANKLAKGTEAEMVGESAMVLEEGKDEETVDVWVGHWALESVYATDQETAQAREEGRCLVVRLDWMWGEARPREQARGNPWAEELGRANKRRDGSPRTHRMRSWMLSYQCWSGMGNDGKGDSL